MGGQSQQADPTPWQGQPLQGSHSVVMSQHWHPSSNRVAEPGFTGESEGWGEKWNESVRKRREAGKKEAVGCRGRGKGGGGVPGQKECNHSLKLDLPSASL